MLHDLESDYGWCSLCGEGINHGDPSLRFGKKRYHFSCYQKLLSLQEQARRKRQPAETSTSHRVNR